MGLPLCLLERVRQDTASWELATGSWGECAADLSLPSGGLQRLKAGEGPGISTAGLRTLLSFAIGEEVGRT